MHSRSHKCRLLELETTLPDSNDAYLEDVLLWPTVPAQPVPLDTFTAGAIKGAFGGCEAYRVLMFRSLLGAFGHEPLTRSPDGWFVGDYPGLSWLDTKERRPLHLPTCEHLFFAVSQRRRPWEEASR